MKLAVDEDSTWRTTEKPKGSLYSPHSNIRSLPPSLSSSPSESPHPADDATAAAERGGAAPTAQARRAEGRAELARFREKVAEELKRVQAAGAKEAARLPAKIFLAAKDAGV